MAQLKKEKKVVKIKKKAKKTPPKVKKQIKKYQTALKKVAKKVKSGKTKPAKKTGKIVIKPNMIISEVIEKYPDSVKVFYDYGITCVGCFLASSETVEQGIGAHGLDVKKFIADLNKELNK